MAIRSCPAAPVYHAEWPALQRAARSPVVVMPKAPWHVAEFFLEGVERYSRRVEEAEALEVKRGLCHMEIWSKLYQAGLEAEFFNAEFFKM